jgi:hypothetical protein
MLCGLSSNNSRIIIIMANIAEETRIFLISLYYNYGNIYCSKLIYMINSDTS